VNVHRLVAVAGVKVEPVRSLPKHSRHSPSSAIAPPIPTDRPASNASEDTPRSNVRGKVRKHVLREIIARRLAAARSARGSQPPALAGVATRCRRVRRFRFHVPDRSKADGAFMEGRKGTPADLAISAPGTGERGEQVRVTRPVAPETGVATEPDPRPPAPATRR
jgi:hypothetical protein